MISHSQVVRALEKESHYWRRQLKTEYVSGILRGLKIAMERIANVKRLSPEEQAKHLARTREWNATKFYKALRAAYHLLRNGNRERALLRLQREIETTKLDSH